MLFLTSLMLVAGLCQAPAAARNPAPIDLVVPAGVSVSIQADRMEYDQQAQEYTLVGDVAIVLTNGVELRMTRARIQVPAAPNPGRPQHLRVEPLEAPVSPARPAGEPLPRPQAPQNADEFAGLGLQLQSKPTEDGGFRVVSVIDTAGDDVKAAVKPDDAITAVDGKSVQGKTIEEVVKLIRGPEGTTIRLTFKRPGEDKPREASLKRKVIRVNP